MGRPRKATNLKLVDGTDRKDRRNGLEPEPELLADLEPPEHLPPRSAVVWRELATMLRRTQVLTVADTIALEMLCDSVADYREARRRRGDSFVTTSPKTGSEMLDQLLIAQQMLSKRADGFMSKFGMDPSSRSKVMIADPQGDLFGSGGASAATGTGRFFK